MNTGTAPYCMMGSTVVGKAAATVITSSPFLMRRFPSSSAVSAINLINEGYEVEACFMRNWDSMLNNDVLGNPNDFNDVCPQEKDYMDALDVANKLGIKLHRIDFVQEYWDHVFSYFLEEYKKGRTPNPDILCNKEIKFKCFLEFALKEGADYIAMGHYANVEHTDHGSYLLRAKDQNKDQTYFLCQLTSAQLDKALFPIGNMVVQLILKLMGVETLWILFDCFLHCHALLSTHFRKSDK